MRKLKTFIEKKHLVFSIIINFLIYFLSLVFGVLRFETIDDKIITYFFSGVGVLNQTAKAMYPNVIIGYFFNILYNISPRIDWFYIVQCILIFVSAVIICYMIKKYIADKYIKYLLIAIYEFVIIASSYQCLNYTRTANIIMITCSLTFLHLLIYDKKKLKTIYLIFLGTGIIFGFLLRKQTPGLCIFFVLIYLIYKIKDIIKNKMIWQVIASGVVFGSIMLTFMIIDYFAYNDDEYIYFKKYTDERVKIVDYSIPDFEDLSKENQEELIKEGISENDYMMAKNWLFFDDTYFNFEMLKKINVIVDKQKKQNLLSYHFKNFWVLEYIPTEHTIALFALLIFLKKYTKNDAKLILFTTGGHFLLFALLMRIVPRIVYGINYNAFVMMTFLLIESKYEFNLLEKSKRRLKIVCAGLLTFFISTLFIDFTIAMKTMPADEIMEEITTHKDNLYLCNVSYGMDNIYTYDFPWKNTDKGFFDNFQMLSSWFAMHPEYEKWFKHKNIENRAKALLEDNAYFIGMEEHIEYLEKYYEEHYCHVKISLYKEFDDYYYMWKIEKTE